MPSPTPRALATLTGVILCWLVVVGIFLLRKRPPKAPEAKWDRQASLGIVLQMCGFFLVWFQPPRQPFLPPVAFLSTVAIAAGSGWLIESAIGTLGKQWALRARLVEEHKLITSGAFA